MGPAAGPFQVYTHREAVGRGTPQATRSDSDVVLGVDLRLNWESDSEWLASGEAPGPGPATRIRPGAARLG